ncbi:hypothetical protein CspeluHIS016_0601360 [Cutaneotrichosporon spelunceum]|uniref:DUF1275 domain protein n=1 Tax=Cutaneotrichosporon spelunceum TaxID=1672016 RepID=A0AAD3TXL2_9TREE|nr:hypothetical protein CspeluHIS016_0601360 [Cutaneotrichosporon spelunceum]
MSSAPLLSDRGLSYDSTVTQTRSDAHPASISTPANGANGNRNGTNGSVLPTHSEAKGSWLSTQLSGKIDPNKCDWISVYGCLLTGFTSAVSFTACYVWPGFQTGNLAQLAIAAARTFDPPATRTHGFMKNDQQALTALVMFWVGTSLGRIGAKVGNTRRAWLVTTSILQVFMAAIAALLSQLSGESPYALDRTHPSWVTPMGMGALGLLATSLGLQGIVGKRIGTGMNTTVVLTTTWVEIFNDPDLFAWRLVPSRDLRVSGVCGVLFGAFGARALLGAIGQARTIGILCALRLVQAAWWMFIPSPA